jgi:hypothetical protein
LVSVIDGATCNSHNIGGCGQTPASAPGGFGTAGIAVDPTTNNVYATNIEDPSVTTINGNSCNSTNKTGCNHTQTRSIVGDYPATITVDPQVGTAYVADGAGIRSYHWLSEQRGLRLTAAAATAPGRRPGPLSAPVRRTALGTATLTPQPNGPPDARAKPKAGRGSAERPRPPVRHSRTRRAPAIDNSDRALGASSACRSCKHQGGHAVDDTALPLQA